MPMQPIEELPQEMRDDLMMTKNRLMSFMQRIGSDVGEPVMLTALLDVLLASGRSFRDLNQKRDFVEWVYSNTKRIIETHKEDLEIVQSQPEGLYE